MSVKSKLIEKKLYKSPKLKKEKQSYKNSSFLSEKKKVSFIKLVSNHTLIMKIDLLVY